MLQFERVIGFDWDQGNARKSFEKHGVDQSEAEQMFFNDPLLILDDSIHSGGEPRFHALGCSDAGRLLHATFTLCREGALIRVISVRDMSRKERTRYAEDA